MLREAAKGFPFKKGFSGWLARWFLFLSDAALQGICEFFHTCERLGLWPGAVRHAMLHLIPKREGGERPIGLVDGLCRLWELVRRPLMRAWRADTWRKYDYGARGRQSTDAVWLQSLFDEAAVEDQATITVLLDLAKAFESVPLSEAWSRGLSLGMPPAILRLALEVCSFTRHLVLQGEVTEGVQTFSAILAGTSFATDILYAVFVGPCDRLQECWPSLNLSLVVDDLALQAPGKKHEVGSVAAGATEQIMLELREIGFMVSAGDVWSPGGKTTAVGSCPQVMARMRTSFRRLGVKTSQHARHLGVDYTPGKRGSRLMAVARGRLKGVIARADRIKRLRLPGKAVNRLVRTALVPASLHGTGVTGVTDAAIKSLVSVAHAAFGNATGRSAYARLSLSGGMPGCREAVQPIVDWARAVFDDLAPTHILDAAWKKAAGNVGLADNPQEQVEGPAGAAMAAAVRIGWQMPSWYTFREADGNVLDARHEAPNTLFKAAMEAMDDWFAGRSKLAEQVEGLPFLEPLLAYSNAKHTSAAVRGSLRAMAEGAWPTQKTLFEGGLADDPLCTACAAAPGTFYHRVRMCPSTAWLRQGGLPKAGMIGPGSSAEEASNSLFRRGIPVAPTRVAPPKHDTVRENGSAQMNDNTFTGQASSDGSMIDPRPVRARRAGWSAVSTDEQGELLFALYGPCPDRCPTSHRAELWGIMMVVASAVLPLTIYTDHQPARDAWLRGKAYCCDGSRLAADLWRCIFERLEAIGFDGTNFNIVWVKAHTSEVDVNRGIINARNRAMNVLADRYAGYGSALAKAEAPNEEQVTIFNHAYEFYGMLGRLCACWPDDYRQDREKPQAQHKSAPVGLGVHAIRPHRLWRQLNGSVICAACKKTSAARSKASVRTLASSPCGACCAGKGAVGFAHKQVVATFVRELTARGAYLIPVRPLAERKEKPSSKPSDPRRATILRFKSLVDLRACGARPFTGGQVAVNPAAGCINGISPDGKSLRLLSGIRGWDVPVSAVNCVCSVDCLNITFYNKIDAKRFKHAIVFTSHLSPIAPLPPHTPMVDITAVAAARQAAEAESANIGAGSSDAAGDGGGDCKRGRFEVLGDAFGLGGLGGVVSGGYGPEGRGVEGAGGHCEDEPLDELGLGGGLSDSSSGPPEGPPPPDLAGGSVGGEAWSAPWRSFGGTLAPPPAPPSPAPTDSDADGWTLIGGQAAAEETEADPPHPHPDYLITPHIRYLI